jgi:hypothetical protein
MPVLCESPMVRDYRTLGITQNVSQRGLLVEAVLPLPQGTSTDLRLLSGDLIPRAEAVVVWTAEGSPGLMGLRFTRMAEASSLAWEQLLAGQTGQDPRTSVRIPVDLEVTCVIPPDTRLRGRAENLSDGGMMVRLPQAVPPQTCVKLKVPGALGLPPMEAGVMWTRAHPEVPHVVHGLRFLEGDIGKELFLIDTLLRRFLE